MSRFEIAHDKVAIFIGGNWEHLFMDAAAVAVHRVACALYRHAKAHAVHAISIAVIISGRNYNESIIV